MSFETICSNCGAPSSPTVGICPFCKATMTNKKSKESPTIIKIKELYEKGDIQQALFLAREAEKSKEKLLKNSSFVSLYVKILIEADAPSSKMKSLLTNALLNNIENAELAEYREIIEAKNNLSHIKNDEGEQALVNILRRSPKNVHALFILGSHLCWVEAEYVRAIQLLERCVALRPKWLRANGCLAALYDKIDNTSLVDKYVRKCVSLAKDDKTKEYFKGLLKG